MTKSEKREVAITLKMQHFGANYVALYRAARSKKSQDEILAIALAYGVVSNDEFVV